jgi:Ca2+-binding RTX toxin-like protein
MIKLKTKAKQIGDAANDLIIDSNSNASYSAIHTDFKVAPVDAPVMSALDNTLQNLAIIAIDPVIADTVTFNLDVILEPNSDSPYIYPIEYPTELFIDTSLPYNITEGTTKDDNLIAESGYSIINGLDGNDIISALNYNHCVLNGGDGIDNILGGSGNNILNGDGGLDYLIGGTGNDVINGGDGNDYLHYLGFNTMAAFVIGDVNRPGNDLLFGGNGADSFVFYGYTLGSGNVAKVMDFISGTDRLMFAAFDSIDYTTINFAESLVQGVGAIAKDANDFIIFDQATGALYYDADGNGTNEAVQLATFVGVNSLSIYDFV